MSLDPTVEGFFTKNVAERYAEQYRLDHSPRLVAMLNHFGLKDMKDQKVADVGGGLGFLGELIDPSNDYWVFDGASTTPETRVAKGTWVKADLDRDYFGDEQVQAGRQFDIAFCLETVEHLGSAYHCLTQIKQLVKPSGRIVISIPTETVTHNVPMPGLLWPQQNFMQFLGQLALPIQEAWTYKPFIRGWPAYHYLCINEGWDKKVMLFQKTEEKFKWATALQMGNL